MLILCFGIDMTYAQGNPTEYPRCAMSMPTTTTNNSYHSHKWHNSYLLNFQPVTFRIHFWGVKTSTGLKSVAPARIDSIMKEINKAFHPFGICFVLSGFDYMVGHDNLYQGHPPSGYGSYAESLGYVDENSINCYLPYRFSGPNHNASGISHGDAISVRTHYTHYGDTTLPAIVSHELGHLFGLRHMFGNGRNGVVEEHVTRDTSDRDNFNAYTAGDQIYDTPAMPNFWNSAFGTWKDSITNQSMSILDTTDCTFDSSQYNFTDEQGTPLQITTYDVRNYMMYAADDCKEHFTTGQGVWMLETIEHNFTTLYEPWTISNPGMDLYVKDSPEDYGVEPNIETVYLWESEDIWVRHQLDGIKQSQNPVYNPSNPNYVYVRIINRSCDTSAEGAKLRVFWTKASPSLSWPYSWIGNYFPNNGPLMGDTIGTVNIPAIAPGESAIVHIPWVVPNPQSYSEITSSPWHFCLLAKVVSNNDPTTSLPNGSTSLNDFVAMNNNVAWKNITVVQFNPSAVEQPIGGVIAVGNPLEHIENFNLEFSSGRVNNKKLFEEAEISISLGDIAFNAWVRGGGISTGLRQEGHTFIVTRDNASLKNMRFNAKEVGTAHLKFNFLTEEVTNQDHYVYRAIQTHSSSRSIFGGETYEIYKSPRPLFYAKPGNDIFIDKGQTVTLNAVTIGEPALYNWYDSKGNLIYQGANFTTSVAIGEKYKLEVIALSDGYKDYGKVKIGLKPNRIKILYPNPTTGQVTVKYQINRGNNAYLAITPLNGGNTQSNYILDIQDHSFDMDLSLMPTGSYVLTLIVEAKVADSKLLLKQ